MKLFSKIATAFVGMAMAIGVGVAVSGNNSKEVRAASTTLTSTFTSTSWADSNSLWNSDKAGTATGDPRGISIQKADTGAGATTKTSYSNVSAASIWLSKSSKGVGSVVLKVGSTTVLTQSTFTSSSTEYAGSIGTTLSGAISFSVTCTTSTIYVEKVQWTYDEGGVSYTITYDANGGTGTMSDTTNTVAACTFTAPEGKTFSTWNTNASGTGTDYAPGATATSDLDLFAIWVDLPDGVVIDKDTLTMTNPSASSGYAKYDGTRDIGGVDIFTSDVMINESKVQAKKSTGWLKNSTTLGVIKSVTLSSDTTNYSIYASTSEITTRGDGTAVTSGADISTSEYQYFAVISGSSMATASSITVEFVTETGKTMRIQNNTHQVGPFEVTYGDTSEYKYALAWDVDGGTALRSGCSWTVSDESIIDFYTNGETWLCYKPKNVGTTTITVSHDDFKTVSTTITVVPGTLDTVTVSGSMTKTSYYVGEVWSNAGLVATANYDTGYVETVTDKATWNWDPSAPATGVTSVTPSATYGGKTGTGSAQAVTVTRTNPIQVLYTQSSGASVDVYGYYVGFLDGTGPVIMDGEYGIVIFDKTADVSGYTEGETILHVTGSISIYNGLYEIGSASISVASGTYDVPSTPVVYATAGGETQEYASRLTTVTGTPTVTKGSFDSDPGTADITMSFDLGGGKSVQVFYKKAAQTADSEAFTAIKAAATDSTEITVKGFTGWYNGFQVQMNGYVKPAEDYTAEDFSQDLLDQTDAVCEDYDGVTNNHDAIEAIWSNLASNDKYPSLPADQKTILAEAARDESGTVVEQAMARYDYLTGKYSLSNFINGRTPVVFAAPSTISSDNNNINSSMSIIVVAVIAITSLSAIGVLLVIKRRKSI